MVSSNWRNLSLANDSQTNVAILFRRRILPQYRVDAMLPRFAILIIFIQCAQISTRAVASEIEYARDIRPILADKCWHCHGPDEQTREADLRLDLRSGASHVLDTEPGTLTSLVERITSSDIDEKMPPEESRKQLTKSEIVLLKQWVDQGAPFTTHWAFTSPVKVDPPRVGNAQPINAIDNFVLHRLNKAGLSHSPKADRATLIRRATLDLTGLPPTLDEVDAFVQNESPGAYEKLLDRLLDSERFGEHLARPWLDASRYADTDGYQNDRYRYMHPWRDWVIMAFNENKPYDEFLIEQLAGDMLPNATLKQQIATGFCRNHRINSEDGSIPGEWHVENVVDRVDTLGTAILGLTIGCARCHDHKYDPISSKEYYELFAYFNNVPEWGVGPNNGNSPPFINVPKSWPHLAEGEDVAQVPEPLKLRRAREEKGNGLKRPQAGSPETAMVMQELDEPRPTFLLVRGQYNEADESGSLTPNVPNALNRSGTLPPANRLELARWLTDPSHPLTARVAMNRIWQQLFGTGLVKTSENFGLQGELPSHPELLDWLAVTFVESGWDQKQLFKTIMLSATYQQSSRTTPELVASDPENRLLARGARFRVDPFVLRDSALSASGLLVETMYGPSAKPYMPPKIWSSISNNKYKQDKGDNLYRRSLYTYWRRTIPPPSMVNFNAAEREVCIVRKEKTNTPLQALTLMNNITFVEASRFLAERMLNHSEEPRDSIRFGFRQMTSRNPQRVELNLLVESYKTFLEEFAMNLQEAEKLLSVGEKPRDEMLDTMTHAAMTMTATLIMNLDESITKE